MQIAKAAAYWQVVWQTPQATTSAYTCSILLGGEAVFACFPPSATKRAPSLNDDGVPELGRILPIVDTVDWVRQLAQTSGITDIQLRIKDVSDRDNIGKRVKLCQKLCEDNGVRLWINDHWEAAIEAGCFGVHVSFESLDQDY